MSATTVYLNNNNNAFIIMMTGETFNNIKINYDLTHKELDSVILSLHLKDLLKPYYKCYNNEITVERIFKKNHKILNSLLRLKKNDKINFLNDVKNHPLDYILYVNEIPLKTLKPDLPFKKIKERFMCPILYDDVEEGYITKCGHKFSDDGLRPWIISHDTCPTCRASLK